MRLFRARLPGRDVSYLDQFERKTFAKHIGNTCSTSQRFQVRLFQMAALQCRVEVFA